MIEIVYVRPRGDHRAFQARLYDVVRSFEGDVQLVTCSASELRHITHERVFVSTTVPNVIVVRRGMVIAHALGDLPTRELDSLLRAAIESAGQARMLAPAA
jgi:hypothetical protein